MKVGTRRSRMSALTLFACAGAFGLVADADASLVRVRRHVPGDVNGDGKADIALQGGYLPGTETKWGSIPVGFSDGVGGFNNVVNNSTLLSSLAPVILEADVNNDGCADMIGLGNYTTNWPFTSAIVVGMSDCAGNLTITSDYQPAFTQAAIGWSIPMVGDFNGDGKWDVALYSGTSYQLWVAFSNGNGTFYTTTVSASELGVPTSHAGENTAPQFVAGDFNGDGKSDIALVGASPYYFFVGLSQGNGSFTPMEYYNEVAVIAHQEVSQVFAGDFNGDGYADIALTGGVPGGYLTQSIPIAYGGPTNTAFSIWTNGQIPQFAQLAERQAGATAMTPPPQAVPGDFNGDGLMDIALLNVAGSNGIPVAFSTANTAAGIGSFSFSDAYSPWMAAVSRQGDGGSVPKPMSAGQNTEFYGWILTPNPCPSCLR